MRASVAAGRSSLGRLAARSRASVKRPKRIEIAEQTETERRAREAQILVNIIEPDPEYQPFLLTDEASPFDVSGTQPEVIRERLEFYFRRPLSGSPPVASAT